MTKLSVNINKIATIRNARGGEEPSVSEAALKCQEFGADGITIHPRPDQRHITSLDVATIRPIVYKEFNIEGYPSKEFINSLTKGAIFIASGRVPNTISIFFTSSLLL